LILASIGLGNKLLSSEMFAVLVVVILVTTLVTPPMMKVFFGRNIEEKV
jgi:Kef-type K+ transport system membrane component KefB